MPTLDAVLGARVPSLCDFPPGRLVDGVLEGTAPDGPEGGVWLEDEVVHGSLGPEAVPVAVGVFSCHHGGSAWPQVLGVLEAGPEESTAQVTHVLSPFEETQFGREWVEDVTFVDGAVEVRWWTGTDEDSLAMGDSPASARYVLDGDALTPTDVVVHTAEGATFELLEALDARDAGAATALADEAIHADLRALVEHGETMREPECTHEDRGRWSCRTLTSGGWYGVLTWETAGWGPWSLTGLEISGE
ncbi:hypothetical protein [Cellulosimicrobium protaetiae]|uniref:DUF4241 domain-containing protein n=1 Tax=Cellulosimicrobium protaetiae TaxID=2587808 RepID=A0A6M5UDT6_9MICO|nr:hypothetical protein [Cellulosimicrobium protaetiae]QJW35501.1 hypothetical protein FIC82_004080 [Cellulosimicrobium protaetiae]